MKRRLDIVIVEKGLAESREKAKAIIMAGEVFVGGKLADKAGIQVGDNDEIAVRGKRDKYVSRGGYKLEKALAGYNISLRSMVCADIGASTGGFTDCMLQSGAIRVYAVDVGYGQLAWRLRNDERVISLERTNIRYLEEKAIPEKLDFIAADVSFISLSHVLPVMNRLLSDAGRAVCLIKPQFEAGKAAVGKKGVVRDPKTHRDVIVRIIESARNEGFTVCGLDYSPLRGPEGNIEYLILLSKVTENFNITDKDIEAVVNESHHILKAE